MLLYTIATIFVLYITKHIIFHRLSAESVESPVLKKCSSQKFCLSFLGICPLFITQLCVCVCVCEYKKMYNLLHF